MYHGFPNEPKLVHGTGFCGAYDLLHIGFATARLFEVNAIVEALINALGTLVAGAPLAELGLAIAAL